MKHKIIAIGSNDGFHGWKSLIGKTGKFKSIRGTSQPGYKCGVFKFDKQPAGLYRNELFFHAVKVSKINP